MKRHWKRIAAVLTVLMLAAALVFWVSPQTAQVKCRLLWQVCSRSFEDAAAAAGGSGAVAEEGKLPFGVMSREVYDGQDGAGRHRGVEFSVGAWGFGSETSYWGIRWCPEDVPLGMGCHELEFRAENGGTQWVWEEPEGDNREMVVKLADQWYWYLAEF